MIELDQTRAKFLASVQDLYAKRKVFSGPLTSIRTSYWQKWLQSELPTRKSEQFRYFPLKDFYLEKFDELGMEIFLHPQMIDEEVLPECQGASIVMVNGRLRLDLSNLSALSKKIVLLPLEKALHSYEIFLTNRYQKLLTKEANPFTLMNFALSQEGGFLYIPPGTQCEKPIQILHFISGKEGSVGLIHPKWQIFIGNNSKVDCIQTCHFIRPQCPVWVNQDIDITLEEGANFSLISDARVEDGHYLFSSTRTLQKRDSKFTFIHVTNGSKAIKQDIECSLVGEGASADVNGFWLAFGDRHVHTYCNILHEAPNTTSNQLFKGILLDSSVSSFEGKIFVNKIAQKTAAYQLNKNLLLGENAKAYTKPNLEIFADDVKASHGATVGYFSDDELFYLAARGIEKKSATRLLTTSFVQDILDKISLQSLRENYKELLTRTFEV